VHYIKLILAELINIRVEKKRLDIVWKTVKSF